jgi:hypothetical protein
VIEVDGEEEGGAGDSEAGDIGTMVAVAVGEGPDGGVSPDGWSKKKECFHLSGL